MLTKLALCVSILCNIFLGLAVWSLAGSVHALQVQVAGLRDSLAQADELASSLKAPPPIAVVVAPAGAPPIRVLVPLPAPKPDLRSHATHNPTPVKPKGKRKYRAPGVVIKCSQVPTAAYWASADTIRQYMRTHGATNRQVRQVLRCVGKG